MGAEAGNALCERGGVRVGFRVGAKENAIREFFWIARVPDQEQILNDGGDGSTLAHDEDARALGGGNEFAKVCGHGVSIVADEYTTGFGRETKDIRGFDAVQSGVCRTSEIDFGRDPLEAGDDASVEIGFSLKLDSQRVPGEVLRLGRHSAGVSAHTRGRQPARLRESMSLPPRDLPDRKPALHKPVRGRERDSFQPCSPDNGLRGRDKRVNPSIHANRPRGRRHRFAFYLGSGHCDLCIHYQRRERDSEEALRVSHRESCGGAQLLARLGRAR